MIKEIVAHVKMDDLEILFRVDSGYFDDDIIETIESAGCQYLIKGKEYPTLAFQVTAPFISFIKGYEGRETTELFTKLDPWDKDRRFVVSCVLFKMGFVKETEYRQQIKTFQIGTHFPGREDHQNSEKSCEETF